MGAGGASASRAQETVFSCLVKEMRWANVDYHIPSCSWSGLKLDSEDEIARWHLGFEFKPLTVV